MKNENGDIFLLRSPFHGEMCRKTARLGYELFGCSSHTLLPLSLAEGLAKYFMFQKHHPHFDSEITGIMKWREGNFNRQSFFLETRNRFECMFL